MDGFCQLTGITLASRIEPMRLEFADGVETFTDDAELAKSIDECHRQLSLSRESMRAQRRRLGIFLLAVKAVIGERHGAWTQFLDLHAIHAHTARRAMRDVRTPGHDARVRAARAERVVAGPEMSDSIEFDPAAPIEEFTMDPDEELLCESCGEPLNGDDGESECVRCAELRGSESQATPPMQVYQLDALLAKVPANSAATDDLIESGFEPVNVSVSEPVAAIAPAKTARPATQLSLVPMFEAAEALRKAAVFVERGVDRSRVERVNALVHELTLIMEEP